MSNPPGVREDLRIYKTIPITLSDGSSASLVPFNMLNEMPESIVNTIHDLLNYEIEQGNTYPQDIPLTRDAFLNYYFANFVAVLFTGEYTTQAEFLTAYNNDTNDENTTKPQFLGCFYIKPNYPGRCSHVCNGGFLVAQDSRGKGVGLRLGKSYVELAPKLGFKSSIFNLVFASNPASWKIWDRLGFQRVGVIPYAGNLKDFGYTDAYVYHYDFTKDDKNNAQIVADKE